MSGYHALKPTLSWLLYWTQVWVMVTPQTLVMQPEDYSRGEYCLPFLSAQDLVI